MLSQNVLAENIPPNNFTMTELENIEYTAIMSYIPTKDEPEHGYKKGVPVKVLHQKFTLDFKDNTRKITQITSKDSLGITTISDENPDHLIGQKPENRFNGKYITIKDERELIINDFTDFSIQLNLYNIDQYLNTLYVIKATEMFDNSGFYKVVGAKIYTDAQPYGYTQRVILSPNHPTFKTSDENKKAGFIVELEAKAVPKHK